MGFWNINVIYLINVQKLASIFIYLIYFISVINFIYFITSSHFARSRLYWRASSKHETDRERLLLCYQSIEQIQQDRFPLTKDLALELAALMAQIDMADVNSERSRGSGSCGPSAAHVLQAYNKFYPPRYKEGSPDQWELLKKLILNMRNN